MSNLNNIGLFFSAREKVLNNFKSEAFLIKNHNKTLTPEPGRKPTLEATPEPVQEPAQK